MGEKSIKKLRSENLPAKTNTFNRHFRYTKTTPPSLLRKACVKGGVTK